MLNEPIIELLKKYDELSRKDFEDKTAAVIRVDEVISKIAQFYEKIRNLVDYHDEHLLRKMFIFRTVRRRLFFTSDENIAEPLIKELIRAGHLPNESVPAAKIEKIQKIIENYLYLDNGIRESGLNDKKKISEWLLDLNVSAIEESLFPPKRENLLADLMLNTILGRLAVEGVRFDADEARLQLFVAVQKSFMRADGGQLQFRIFKMMHPNWKSFFEDKSFSAARDLPATRKRLERIIKNPASAYLLKLCNFYNTPYFILSDIVNEAGSLPRLEYVLSDEKELEKVSKTAYEKRLNKESFRLRRMAFFSVISFFISKIAVALMIEIPIERNITHSFSAPITLFNILFPPLLMFFIVIMIKLPSSQNFKIIFGEIKRIVYSGQYDKYVVTVLSKRNILMDFTVKVMYLAIFIAVFYGLWRTLLIYNFSPANIIILSLFTSLVIATGVRINNRSKEISMEKEKSGLGMFILDLAIMPFVTVGQWVIAGLLKFNIFAIAINFIVELPFQLFLEFLENLRRFIIIKKEEIR